MEQLLTSLAVLSARTELAEKKILDAAIARRKTIIEQMNTLRTDALLDENGSAEEYMHLVTEFGQLEKVIALAKERLSRQN